MVERRSSYPIQQSPTFDRHLSLTSSPSRVSERSDDILVAEHEQEHVGNHFHHHHNLDHHHKLNPPDTICAISHPDKPQPKRTLVICLDGTGDTFDQDNSNVVKLVSCLKKDDPNQLTYYQAGIGTYSGKHSTQQGLSAAVDMAFGNGLSMHVKDAYRFLMQNYREGDRISLFGFSRGAYTVRCLAGMLHKVGLLPKSNGSQLLFAYKMFKDDTKEGWKMSHEFKRTFCNDVDIHFMGCWDCVASVGFIPRTLPFSKSSNRSVRFFRHALALDEHRAKFKACHWIQQAFDTQPIGESEHKKNKKKAASKKRESDEKKSFPLLNVFKEANEKSDLRTLDPKYTKEQAHYEANFDRRETMLSQLIKKTDSDNGSDDSDDDDMNMYKKSETDVLEVWFAGAHADVGGGSVLNSTRHQISRIPLRWMIRQCFEVDSGILFNMDALANVGVDIHTLWPIYVPPKIPTIGPSPTELEKYEKECLPPIELRSLALRHKVWPDTLGVLPKKLKEEYLEYLHEHIEDHFDAAASINDQLAEKRFWWILEIWPVKIRVQRPDNTWKKVIGWNLGRYRSIRHCDPKLHWTVQYRVDQHNYVIKTRKGRDVHFEVVA